MTDLSPPTTPDTSQVLLLGLAEEILAIDAQLVREIIDPVPVTRVPGAPAHLPAVVNVRGAIIPLADLRSRFGGTAAAASRDTRFVVLELPLEGGAVVVGLVADRVYEVTDLPAAGLRPVPQVGLGTDPSFIRAVASWNDGILLLPDLERLLH